MPYKNKKDQLRCQREWYIRNKQKAITSVNNRRKDLSIWFKNYKINLKCELCSENNYACLDFHHINEKFMTVSEMVHEGYSKLRILEEIKKCNILCSNCHRKLHWEERQ